MNAAAAWLTSSMQGLTPEAMALRGGFLRWQCRVRQLAMRERAGRPDDAVTPLVVISGSSEPLGHIITVLNRQPAASVTPEMQHMVRSTHDPAQRRDKALTFFSAGYFQKASEFSDTLTATFQAGSQGAAELLEKRECSLVFEAFNQRFDLQCQVIGLGQSHPLYQSTIWHNQLFNPGLGPATTVLGFVPDWQKSNAEPAIPH